MLTLWESDGRDPRVRRRRDHPGPVLRLRPELPHLAPAACGASRGVRPMSTRDPVEGQSGSLRCGSTSTTRSSTTCAPACGRPLADRPRPRRLVLGVTRTGSNDSCTTGPTSRLERRRGGDQCVPPPPGDHRRRARALHVPPRHAADSIPLILTHGWPWTFWHWSRVVDELASPPDDTIPSWTCWSRHSRASASPRRSTERGDISFWKTADIWHSLMTEVLGLDRYVAGGCDVGGTRHG